MNITLVSKRFKVMWPDSFPLVAIEGRQLLNVQVMDVVKETSGKVYNYMLEI